MIDCIVHRDIFALLAPELGLSPDHVRAMLSNGDSLTDRLEEQLGDSPFARFEIPLHEALPNPLSGAPLLAAGANLSLRKLRSLLVRQARHPEQLIGPFSVDASSGLADHYRSLVVGRLDDIAIRARNQAGSDLKAAYARVREQKRLPDIDDEIRRAMQDLLASPAAISSLLPNLLGDAVAHDLVRGFHTAYFGVAALLSHPERSLDRNGQAELGQLAGASILQAVAGKGARCGTEMPGQAEEGHLLPGSVVDPIIPTLIANYSTVVDDQEQPLLSGNRPPPLVQRVLTCTHVFLDEVLGAASGSAFEGVKNAYHLADHGFIDELTVSILANFYLPRLKSIIIQKASQIGDQCPVATVNPIMWPLIGDKLPTVFLCPADQCEDASSQVTVMARDIPILVDGNTVSTVPKGTYHTCSALSEELQSFYLLVKKRTAGNAKG